MSRQRLDWVDFFRSVPQPHGVRLRLAGIDATAPESLTAEKRLVRIVRALAASEPFALHSGISAKDRSKSRTTVRDALNANWAVIRTAWIKSASTLPITEE